jgi:hypothetical protein
LSPEEVLPVVAVALLAGLRGPAVSRAVLFVLTTAWMLGAGAAGFGGSLAELSGQLVTAALFLLVGGLLVIEPFTIGGLGRRAAPRVAVIGAAGLLGLIRGNVDWSGFMASATALGPGVWR